MSQNETYPSEPLVRQIIERPAFVFAGIRKIAQNLTWEMKELPRVTFDQIGYGKNKLTQLRRNYINDDEFDRVRTILRRRKNKHFTSVALSMRGAGKDARSMGWCMLSLVVTRGPRVETVEVQYRSTEVILKFGGDLAFLPSIFEDLGLEPDLVRFHFANAFCSGVYFPTLCSEWEPIDFLDYLRRTDEKFFATATRYFWRASMAQHQHFPYSPEKQQHKFLWSRLRKSQISRIRDYLAEHHEKYGKPLPTPHLTEE